VEPVSILATISFLLEVTPYKVHIQTEYIQIPHYEATSRENAITTSWEFIFNVANCLLIAITPAGLVCNSGIDSLDAINLKVRDRTSAGDNKQRIKVHLNLNQLYERRKGFKHKLTPTVFQYMWSTHISVSHAP